MGRLTEFSNYLLRKGISLGTRDKHVASLNNILRNVGSLEVNAIDNYIMSLLEKQRSHDHINNIVAAVRHYGRFVKKQSEYKKIRYLPPTKPEERHIALMSDSELEAFIAITPEQMLQWFKEQNVKRAKACDANFDKGIFEMFSLFFKIAIFSVMRLGEVAKLEIDMINFGAEVFELPVTKTIPRKPPLDPILVPELQQYIKNLESNELFLIKGKKVTRNNWRHQFKIRCKYLGIKRKGLRPYTTRHSGGTRLLRNGVSLPLVKKIMGHKLITTTEIYTHLITEDVVAAKKQDPLGRKSVQYDDRFKYVQTGLRELLDKYATNIEEKKKMMQDLLYLP